MIQSGVMAKTPINHLHEDKKYQPDLYLTRQRNYPISSSKNITVKTS